MGRKDAINSSLDVIVTVAAEAAGRAGGQETAQGDENGGFLQAITTTIHLAQCAPLLG